MAATLNSISPTTIRLSMIAFHPARAPIYVVAANTGVGKLPGRLDTLSVAERYMVGGALAGNAVLWPGLVAARYVLSFLFDL
jgi:hypothetical protein